MALRKSRHNQCGDCAWYRATRPWRRNSRRSLDAHLKRLKARRKWRRGLSWRLRPHSISWKFGNTSKNILVFQLQIRFNRPFWKELDFWQELQVPATVVMTP